VKGERERLAPGIRGGRIRRTRRIPLKDSAAAKRSPGKQDDARWEKGKRSKKTAKPREGRRQTRKGRIGEYRVVRVP